MLIEQLDAPSFCSGKASHHKKSLIEQGLDLYAQDDQGRTPFDVAVENCSLFTAQNLAKLYKE